MEKVFFFNDTATTEIYTLSLHDALPISRGDDSEITKALAKLVSKGVAFHHAGLAPSSREIVESSFRKGVRSEEHTSELQSRQYLVCRLLLEKKNNYLTLHTSLLNWLHYL